MQFESTLSQFHCMSISQHEQEDLTDRYIPTFSQQSVFFFSNKVLFWDFSRMIVICHLPFFFHIYDRWRNSVEVRVLRVLFFWKYTTIFLPSVSHVTPTPFTSSIACSKEFHYLTAQFWEVFLFFVGTLPPDLASQWFYSTFPHPFSNFLLLWTIPPLWSFFPLFSLLHRLLCGGDRRSRTIGKHSFLLLLLLDGF